MNTGEELVSSYLRYIRGCEFTQKNLYTIESQGEIDVVGINLKEKTVYICEVAIHLITGLQYTKNSAPNNVLKITEKLSRDIDYANTFFSEYKKHIMFWSPIIKKGQVGAVHSQIRDVEEIKSNIFNKYGIVVEFIINETFLSCLSEMRDFAQNETSELQCPIMRLMQIEGRLKMHVAKINKVMARSDNNFLPTVNLNKIQTGLIVHLEPNDEREFKRRLLLSKEAEIKITYTNGRKPTVKIWNAAGFSESSSVMGNITSRHEFRIANRLANNIKEVYVTVK